MLKKIALLLFALTFVFAGGCWNYRGLNEMTVVIGMAIDRNDSGGGYKVTFETIDLSVPIRTQGFRHQLIESEGKTIFDAARNAKKRNENKLYYGHMMVVLLSNDIAQNEDLGGIVDWYMRDAECRETLCFAVSQEPTARELFSCSGHDESLISPGTAQDNRDG